MVGVVGSSPIAPTKFHVAAGLCRRKARPHGKPRKRVYRYKRPGTDLAAACKVAASFKSEPRTAYVVRGFFFGGVAAGWRSLHRLANSTARSDCPELHPHCAPRARTK